MEVDRIDRIAHNSARQQPDRPQGGGTVLLVDPRGSWRGKMADLILAIRDRIPGVVVRSLTPYRHGYRLNVSDVEMFRAGVSLNPGGFNSCSTELPARPAPTLEVAMPVPVGVEPADVVRDLRERAAIGEAVLTARRLHATTEGRVDRSRPLPRMIITVRGNDAAAEVRRTQLFGVLAAPKTAGKPREAVRVPLCMRCFTWGHRAGQCDRKRRCIRCGADDHLSAACPTPREDTRCLNCAGGHAATYAGCPSRLKAARLLARVAAKAAQNTRSGQTSRPPADAAKTTTPASPQLAGRQQGGGRAATPTQIVRADKSFASVAQGQRPTEEGHGVPTPPPMEAVVDLHFDLTGEPPLDASDFHSIQQKLLPGPGGPSPHIILGRPQVRPTSGSSDTQPPSKQVSCPPDIRAKLTLLNNLERELEEAMQEQAQAQQENQCLRNDRTKRACRKAGRRCGKIRKHIKAVRVELGAAGGPPASSGNSSTSALTKSLAALNQVPKPGGSSQPGTAEPKTQAQPDTSAQRTSRRSDSAADSSGTGVPTHAQPGSTPGLQLGTRAPSLRDGHPTTSQLQPSTRTRSPLGSGQLAARLVRSLQTLAGLARDPRAAAAAIDQALASLADLLEAIPPS